MVLSFDMKNQFFARKKDGFGQENQFFPGKKMVLGRKTNFFLRENPKNNLFGVWLHRVPKDGFWVFCFC